MTDDQSHKPVPAVQNAMMIMRLLATTNRPMGATQIARETEMNVSSAFNILRTLAHEGLLSFDPITKTYRVGMGLMELAAPLLGANPSDLLRSTLNSVAQDHRVTIALWQITPQDRIVLIDRFAAPNIVQAVIARNTRLPVFAGAFGRSYAATLGLSKAATRKGFDTVRWQQEPDFDAYWQDVATAKAVGYGRDRGQLFRGLDIVATIARDGAGSPRLGMSSITIAAQHDDESLAGVGKALAEAAQLIERCLFVRPAGP
ncbi:IclR family transcriptional regulator (plasmid) [Pseudorhodobacter turbinis]|uniref:IclR family transcriptional regulator n=1 Tax=Pseudorhodobacter turbinis TaxID=2500533 RepID=A0A4P8EL06_9RHOB|nr:helix-turn-helix domain-containing protein [Pseudorhodobacter turbinis]QCO57736.1 IclR family transcriptional regulator [Pseudorhodobacter turbinis]